MIFGRCFHKLCFPISSIGSTNILKTVLTNLISSVTSDELMKSIHRQLHNTNTKIHISDNVVEKHSNR